MKHQINTTSHSFQTIISKGLVTFFIEEDNVKSFVLMTKEERQEVVEYELLYF